MWGVYTLIRMNILIMFTQLGLRTRGIDRSIGKRLTLPQARLDGETVDRAVSLVLLPRGAGDVTAHDGLNGQDAELADLHAAVLEDGAQRLGDLRGQVEGQEVRAEGGEGGGEHFEPFAGAEGEEDAFVGDALYDS